MIKSAMATLLLLEFGKRYPVSVYESRSQLQHRQKNDDGYSNISSIRAVHILLIYTVNSSVFNADSISVSFRAVVFIPSQR